MGILTSREEWESTSTCPQEPLKEAILIFMPLAAGGWLVTRMRRICMPPMCTPPMCTPPMFTGEAEGNSRTERELLAISKFGRRR